MATHPENSPGEDHGAAAEPPGSVQATDPVALSKWVRQQARDLGFDEVGICPANPLDGPVLDRFQQWLERGYGGEMAYLSDRMDAYHDPEMVLQGAKSIVMMTMNYRTEEPTRLQQGEARVSRYAWGSVDYHDLIHDRMKSLIRRLEVRAPRSRNRGVVDTAPLMERDYARLAGVGWQGKNTLLLNRDRGSNFFLAALLTDLELQYDEPFAADHCGTCTACLDACPTDAFPQPYVLDATRCISYLTIELRSDISKALRPQMGEWLFGCDVCQDVCPWNGKKIVSQLEEKEQAAAGFQPLPGSNPVDLVRLFEMDDDSFRKRFRKTPLWRSKRHGILRNAAISLGAQKHVPAARSLMNGLGDEHALVRSAAAWALGEIGSTGPEIGPQILESLESQLAQEADEPVADEIRAAISRIGQVE